MGKALKKDPIEIQYPYGAKDLGMMKHHTYTSDLVFQLATDEHKLICPLFV